MESTESTWGVSSQVKSYFTQVAAIFFTISRRQENVVKSTSSVFREHIFPNLAVLARNVMCLSSSSLPVEEMFSSTGIFTKPKAFVDDPDVARTLFLSFMI